MDVFCFFNFLEANRKLSGSDSYNYYIFFDFVTDSVSAFICTLRAPVSKNVPGLKS